MVFVPATHDKRRRSYLDFFVLAPIESGISTPYELKGAADISPGASIPALRRFVSERLVIQGKPGFRGRTDYQISWPPRSCASRQLIGSVQLTGPASMPIQTLFQRSLSGIDNYARLRRSC